MAIKVQYNKTFRQQLEKELKVRLNALPTLQAKESALRVEVKKAKQEKKEVLEEEKENNRKLENVNRLWNEFPSGLIKIKGVDLDIKKIAGVKTPVYKSTSFEISAFSLFERPPWIPGGIELLKKAVELKVRADVAEKKVKILEYARKKTTQKVNLYEKVQIPEYQSAMLKIKRFLEDKENLEKSSQKILKSRLANAEAA